MGIVLHAGANMMPLVGALYGWPTALGGWVSHMGYSILLGVVFAMLVSRWQFHDRTTSLFDWAVYGVLYAAAIGLVTVGIVVPIALNIMGTTTLPQPIFPLQGILGSLLVAFSVGVAHMIYGMILGVTYGHIHSASVSSHEPVE